LLTYFFSSKIAIYLSLGLQATGKPSALNKEHPALQNINFQFLWVDFDLLDPAPDPNPVT
jgi:hypothetical protein